MGLLDFNDPKQRDALNMGLLQAGLGILAANDGRRSGMSAVGLGGLKGLQGYMGSMEAAKAEQKELDAKKQQQAEAQAWRGEVLRRMQDKGVEPSVIQKTSMLPDSHFMQMGEALTKSMADRLVPKAPEFKAFGGGLYNTNEVGPDGAPLRVGDVSPVVPIDRNPDGTMKDAVHQQLVQQRAAGANRTNVNVDSRPPVAALDDKFLTKSAQEFESQFASAQNSARLIGEIDDAAKVLGEAYTGPGATWKQKLSQFFGYGQENVDATRKVIQALAKMEVGSREQLRGQGTITDSEAEALRRAESGDIDSMTESEIRLVFSGARKAHAWRVQTYQRRQKLMYESATRDSVRNMFGSMTVDLPPLPSGGSRDSAVDAALKKYGQ